MQSCAKTDVSVEDAAGNVEFRCGALSDVQHSPASTKAGGEQTRALPEGTVPESSGLHLKITGPDGYSAEYGTVAEYGSPSMKAGAYTAVFSSGDPEKEGPDAAYFEKVHEFTVIARKTSTENVSVALANSVFSVVVSKWFSDYYPEYDILIETESGYQAALSAADNGPFPRTEIAVTMPCTWQTLRIDASDAASGTIEIELDDTAVEIREISIELNPDAPDDADNR